MGTVARTKVTIQDSCDAKRVMANLPDGEKQVVVGTLYGTAQDFVLRASPDGGKQFEGFAGYFEVVPASPERDTITSGVLFLPEGFHPLVADKLRPDNVASVNFAAQILLVRAKNPAGYSWGLEFLQDATAVDPLAEMKAALNRQIESRMGNVAQLEHQGNAPKQASSGRK